MSIKIYTKFSSTGCWYTRVPMGISGQNVLLNLFLPCTYNFVTHATHIRAVFASYILHSCTAETRYAYRVAKMKESGFADSNCEIYHQISHHNGSTYDVCDGSERRGAIPTVCAVRSSHSLLVRLDIYEVPCVTRSSYDISLALLLCRVVFDCPVEDI
jgi:hypothetical protein